MEKENILNILEYVKDGVLTPEQAYVQLGEYFPRWMDYTPGTNTGPKTYGKYNVKRKDGKVHSEVWNNTGWAYNDNVIVSWFNPSDN
jgi:hypothetical protein